jgi:ubiquinone/menaquinone biosynthesis C-methylase UbiE
MSRHGSCRLASGCLLYCFQDLYFAQCAHPATVEPCAETESNMAVIDVGCGSGDDAREIAGLVGSLGRVVGLDQSAAMVDESRRRAADAGSQAEFVRLVCAGRTG